MGAKSVRSNGRFPRTGHTFLAGDEKHDYRSFRGELPLLCRWFSVTDSLFLSHSCVSRTSCSCTRVSNRKSWNPHRITYIAPRCSFDPHDLIRFKVKILIFFFHKYITLYIGIERLDWLQNLRGEDLYRF